MARKNEADSRTPRQKKRSVIGFLFSPLFLSIKLSLFLLGTVILSTLLEWGGMMTGIFELNHAAKVLEKEIGYLGDNLSMTILGMSAEEAGLRVVTFFQGGLMPIPTQMTAVNANGQDFIVIQWIEQVFANWPYYRNAFIFVLMIIGVRFVIITLSSLLFIVVAFAAAVDGLHLRELRKITGGIEHAGIYHHAKALIPFSIWIAPILYLASPVSIHPNFILLPGLVMFFITVLVSFATFKKYL